MIFRNQRTNMESVDKKNFKDLDGWIEQLMECKQLSENQVGKLI